MTVALYQGRDIRDLTREELLQAFVTVGRELQSVREMHLRDMEIRNLFARSNQHD
jgi:hypothetical protein